VCPLPKTGRLSPRRTGRTLSAIMSSIQPMGAPTRSATPSPYAPIATAKCTSSICKLTESCVNISAARRLLKGPLASAAPLRSCRQTSPHTTRGNDVGPQQCGRGRLSIPASGRPRRSEAHSALNCTTLSRTI
jgi:hypothetical protein